MIVALVTNEAEVELIQKHYEEKVEKWVALEPFCIPRLQEHRLKFETSADLFDKEQIFQEVSELSDKKVKKLIELTDSWVRKNYSWSRESGLSLLKYYYYYLTILFDGVLSRLWILRKIFSSLRYKKIVICKKKSSEGFSNQFPWKADESIWAYCADALQPYTCCRLNIIEYSKIPGVIIAEERSLGRTIQDIFPIFYDFVEILKKEGLLSAIKLLRSQKIIMFDLNYQWRAAKDLFMKQGYRFVQINTFRNRHDKVVCMNDYVSIIGLTELLYFDDIDISPLVKLKLNRIISIGLTYFDKYYRKALKILTKTGARAVVFSVITEPSRWVFLAAARASGIPIFCWGHGASGQAKFTKQKINELLICDFYLSQGNGSQKTYEGYEDFAFKAIPIGLPCVDYIKKQQKKRKPKYHFLYVITGYYQHNFYFSFYPGIFSMHLFNTVDRILGFLLELDGKSIIKTASEPMDLYNQYMADNLFFERKKSFSELIMEASAIIIDAPTTTLLEALTTSKPVFVLTEFIKLNDLACSLLTKRAICKDDVNDLISYMQKYVSEGIYDADVHDTSYLKAFGNYLDDGRSGERGVEECLTIVESKRCLNTLTLNE